MRKTVIFAAAAGLAIGLFGTVGANAMTNTSPAGARAATEALDTSDLVRLCKCKESSSVEIRRGRHVGVGVEERGRSRTSIHSRTTTRGEKTSVRGSVTSKTGASTKSSTKSTTSTGKTGETKSGETKSGGGSSGRAQGEKSSTGGSTGGSSGSSTGGSSGSQSGGQKQ